MGGTAGLEAAARLLAGQAEAMQAALRLLVDVNSFTENVAGGNQVGALLAPLFDVGGMEPRVVKSTRFADHRIFASHGRHDTAPIALVGHLDTVFPPGTFEGYRRDGALAR